MDCRSALKITPSHFKAIYRHVQCCLSLKRYDEALEAIDKGLVINNKDEILLQNRQKASEAKVEFERNKRRNAAREKKEKQQVNKLLEAIKSRNIKIEATKGPENLEL